MCREKRVAARGRRPVGVSDVEKERRRPIWLSEELSEKEKAVCVDSELRRLIGIEYWPVFWEEEEGVEYEAL